MYFKEQRYEKAKASTLASTHTVELPETGLLDSISLQFALVNKSAVYDDSPTTLHHNITKIEVIGDNDKSLFSMRGEQAIAKAYRKMKSLPEMLQNGYGGKTQWGVIPIFFGRRYKDGHYALDLSKWDKVELQVTNAVSSTYFTSLSMETRLCTIEDSVEAHPKFLKQWEYEAEKPAAATSYIRPKLPTSGMLRALMIQLDPDLTALTGQIAEDPIGDSYNWKLWFKDRALTVRDHRPKDLMRDEHYMNGLGIGQSGCLPYPSKTQRTDFHWAYVENVTFSPIHTSDADIALLSFEDSRGRMQILNSVGGSTFYMAHIRGIGLFHTFEIPFYIDDIETEYLDLNRYKPIEIEWYGFEAGNTHRIILEKPIGQGPAEYA